MTLEDFLIVWGWLGLYAGVLDAVLTRRRLAGKFGEQVREYTRTLAIDYFGSIYAAVVFSVLCDVLCPPVGLLTCWITYQRVIRDSRKAG